MKKLILIFSILFLLFSQSACNKESKNDQDNGIAQPTENTQKTDEENKKAVTDLVETFGNTLQTFSLLEPKDILDKDMEDSYSGLVSQNLIDSWKADPLNAPGRLVSSPWPDRIEIKTLNKISKGEYQVEGNIIEITNDELEHGGFFAERPITLTVRETNNKWMIDEVSLGEYQESTTITYNNENYGFKFQLPKSWVGYQIIETKWEGRSIEETQSGEIVESGTIISIRHPLWTKDKPRQDIPIMIFTLSQWDLIQEEKTSVGAAPINPSELGRNNNYVFA
ncbi:hypothetical protein E8P77_19770, partial [Soehngenia saccharolytica]